MTTLQNHLYPYRAMKDGEAPFACRPADNLPRDQRVGA